MKVKKFLIGALFAGSFALTNTGYGFGFPLSAQQTNGQTGGQTQYKTQTPRVPNIPTPTYGGTSEEESQVLNLLADIEFFNILAAVIKQNHLLLDRIPYSAQDNFPALLYNYKEEKNLQTAYKQQYDSCLNQLLRQDFPLYDVLQKAPMSFGWRGILRKTQEAIIGKVGQNLENTKVVLLYKEGSCLCPAYSKVFNLNIPSQACSVEKKECDQYYNTPLENLVVKYYFQAANGQQVQWTEMQIPQSCLKPVKGYIYSNFKEAFYSLLPRDRVAKVKDLEEEILKLQQEISELKGKIKALEQQQQTTQSQTKTKTQSPEEDINTLNKKLEAKQKRMESLIAERNKLYDQLVNTIEYPTDSELRKEKLQLARNLLTTVRYIRSVNDEVLGLNTVNLAKTIYDIYQAATNLGGTLRGVMIVTAKYGFQNKGYLESMVKNIFLFIPQGLANYYYLSDQNDFIEPYEKYLEVYLELAKRAY